MRALPWRTISLVAVATVVVVGVVPQLRRPITLAVSRAVLFAASPLAPGIRGFDALPRPTRVVAADGSPIARLDGGQHHRPVRVRSLPPHVVHAVLAAEDEHFYAHGGVDPLAMLRAVVHDVRGDQGTQGGSTITQQLAKLNYTGSRRTVLRKLREVLYAARLERTYGKSELLERYLNQVYFGEGSYGLAAAA